MTHFNHEWDTTKTPAVPVSVGDRYYAQDLNDDFNYLKHLPYEVFLQGRSRGVMIAPADIWDNDTNSLILEGGFGVTLQDCIELDPNEDFAIPPKTHSSSRYERIPFANTTLVLPNDGAVHYIVATPTKRSLLQRIKALIIEQYASRVRYDGVITIQDTAPTAEQILVGLCHDKEYCLLIDNDVNQCKDNIILKKWFGQEGTTNYTILQQLKTYYNTEISSITATILVNTVGNGRYGASDITFNNCDITIDTTTDNTIIYSGTFNNCRFTINTINGAGVGFYDGTFNNCKIVIAEVNNKSVGIRNGTFNNCDITIGTVRSSVVGKECIGIGGGVLNNCKINIGYINEGSGVAYGIRVSTLNNCKIDVGYFNYGAYAVVNSDLYKCIIHLDNTNEEGYGGYVCFNCRCVSCDIIANNIRSDYGINQGTYKNCTIKLKLINANAYGIYSGEFDNCTISIEAVSGTPVYNNSNLRLYLTRIDCGSLSSISSTGGKLNVLNNSVVHAS